MSFLPYIRFWSVLISNIKFSVFSWLDFLKIQKACENDQKWTNLVTEFHTVLKGWQSFVNKKKTNKAKQQKTCGAWREAGPYKYLNKS